jgi:hypothetical protein
LAATQKEQPFIEQGIGDQQLLAAVFGKEGRFTGRIFGCGLEELNPIFLSILKSLIFENRGFGVLHLNFIG